MRDSGPTFVVNDKGDVRGVDWDFNAYGGFNGGLYFPWDQDRKISSKVMEIENIDRYKAPLILEGGSIHVDGEGTLLTTKECLLNKNRNPHLSKEEIEAYLIEYLNIEKIIWFPRGIVLDETDGHIDDLVCFVRPGEVMLTWTDDESDPQYEISREALEVLENSTDAKGRKFKVHKLVQPGPMVMTRKECQGIDLDENAKPRNPGDRLAGSYINFYFANGGVVVPLFDDKHDGQAMALITTVFPERKVVGVSGREILLGGGCIHCITQQQPSGK
jgi:agmatine deiminase